MLKFAGDALLVLWPPKPKDMISLSELTLLVTQCCLDIQAELNKFNLADDVKLKVKLGIGVGPSNVLHIGSFFFAY